MKTKKSLIFAACAAVVLSSIPFSVSAAESDYIYGTMDIPYADFYKAELGSSVNAYDVDAVSSATASKWSMNEEGKLVEGTFNKANEDGQGGQILGVTYPVAITRDALSAIGENNYNFKELLETPAAYKVASVEDGDISFSEVKDSNPEKLTGKVTITADTAWGDYLVNVEDKPQDMGAIYGAVIKTTDNKSYGMRHLENIWRGELAWSSGIKKTEPHGNALSYKNYEDIMGATISEVIYITKNGYYTAETSLYVPVKFEGAVTVENASVDSGKTTLKTENIPEDFEISYSFNNDLSASVEGDTVNFRNGNPGSYTVTVSDKNGKYADISGSFMLTTDKMPAKYEDKTISIADGSSITDFANFMSKISKVTVNDTAYNASGRGAVKIINDDGTINMEAASRDSKVFDGSDKYTVKVEATGYEKSLEFVIENKEPEITTNTTTTSATTTKSNAVTTTNNSAKTVSSSPKTGEKSNVAAAVFALTLAGTMAAITSKRKKK